MGALPGPFVCFSLHGASVPNSPDRYIASIVFLPNFMRPGDGQLA